MAVTIPEAVKELFRAKNFGHVATLMPDGSPHSTAIWVDVEGEHVKLNSDESYRKVKNLRRDPRVVVSIIDSEKPYRSAMIRGRVVAFRHEGASEHIDSLSRKYLDGKDFGHAPNEQRVILDIEPLEVYPHGL